MTRMSGQTKTKPFKLKMQIPKEDYEQICLATWLDRKGILYTASANGGSRYMAEAVKLKRMGVKKGYPDITIPIARKGYHGLYIELKRVSGGILSPEQKMWLAKLNAEGNLALRANGFQEAANIIEDYLGDWKPTVIKDDFEDDVISLL